MFIKEYQEASMEFRDARKNRAERTCFIRPEAETVFSDLALLALFNEAKKDFPRLQDKDIVTLNENASDMVVKIRVKHGGAGPQFHGIRFALRSGEKLPRAYTKLQPVGGAEG